MSALIPSFDIPLVVDTNVLLNDLVYGLRTRRSTALCMSLQTPIPVLASWHVADEVERHLDSFARARGVSASEARPAWREKYSSKIRFVEVAVEQFSDRRIQEVLVRDADDAPTACLGLLVAPSIVLSTDKDLAVPGFAADDWLRVARALPDAIRRDGMNAVGGAALVGTGYGVIGASRAVMSAARLIGWPAIAALAAVSFGVGRAYWLNPVSNRYRHVLREMGRKLGPILLETIEKGVTADRLIRTALIQPEADNGLIAPVASVLARAHQGLTAAEIASDLRNQERARGTGLQTEIRSILRSSPTFVEIRRGRWELGRKGMG